MDLTHYPVDHETSSIWCHVGRHVGTLSIQISSVTQALKATLNMLISVGNTNSRRKR